MYQYGGQWTQMQQQQQRLPPGWEVKWDPGSSRWFYVNHINKKTQWEPPGVQPAGSYASQAAQQSTTTSFIQADPDKVRLLISEYENLSQEYTSTVLRIHQNNLGAARKHLSEKGYKKKTALEPKPHFVSALKKQYPNAPETIIKEILVSTLNNFQGARAALEAMGYEKAKIGSDAKTTAKPVQSSSASKIGTPSKTSKSSAGSTTSATKVKKDLTEAEKAAKLQQLKKKFPAVGESLIKLSLQGTMYDVDVASAVLQSSIDSVKVTPESGRPKTAPTSSQRQEETFVKSTSLSPVIFGAEEEKKLQKEVPVVQNVKESSPGRPSTTSATITYSDLTKKYFVPKKTEQRREPIPSSYSSKLCLHAKGPNPELCNGPNHSLLIPTRLLPMGPNKAIRQGPQKLNRCGPLPSNVRGRAGIDIGPAGVVGRTPITQL